MLLDEVKGQSEAWKLQRRSWKLYRIYRADGALIYVGVTSRPVPVRIGEHHRKQKWSDEIHSFTEEDLLGGAEVVYAVAEQEELKFIAAELPLANKDGNGKRGEMYERTLNNGLDYLDALLLMLALLLFIGWVCFNIKIGVF